MEIRIKPTKTLFFADDTFFGIYGAEVNPDDMDKVKLNKWGNISIKGTTPKLSIGEEYIAVVKEDKGSAYAGSYILETIRQEKPVTIAEQRTFLETILTPTQVTNIFEKYSEGQDIVGMIEDGTFDYSDIKGIAEKTFQKLREKVMNNLEMNEVLVFLSKYGIKYNMIQKLVKEYKNPQIVIQKIEENPYLLTELKGIGFKKADEIAKAVGYDMTSPHRIDSCIRFVIGEENMNGHSWIGFKQLLNRCIELLNINKSYIEDRLNEKADKVVKREDRYTTKAVIEAEQNIARYMTQLKSNSNKMFETEELEEFLDAYCAEKGVELEENQRKFFHDWNENNILFLVGGGGMGKSWLQQILLELVSKKNLSVALLAPTGKASKVMTNYTGKQASTIHRKIGLFDSDEEANGTIEEDVVIVDESSMCDVFVLSNFFNSINNANIRVLFVGDDFQLPSVGVGNFLYDAIHSNCITISRLKKVFRQKDGGILNVATDIREGKQFLNDSADGRIVFGKDCVFHLADQEFLRDGYIHYYKKILQKFDADDIVILSPTKKGKLGTVEINKEVQKIINPASATKKEKTFGKQDPITFRVGDSVMNTVNTYQIETIEGGTADIFNGDTGKITNIDEDEKVFIVDFEGIVVKMKFDTVLSSLLHSWAMTIHKSQGSQFKVVIVIVDRSMTYQLNANLLYTGVSRAKEYLLVLGQAQTINRGIQKFANMERRSFMQELLDEFNTGEAVFGYEEMEGTSYISTEEEDCIA
ncbi:Dda-like helicase [Bacillus phage vB_BcoS-136]|uniref:Exodeoxyribonuclease V alpha chain n=1 Tax=Bacillus phage vB_BcoS-136 TaxID=2419619 RepID=A0A3G3BVQ2_9CAUD|nr:Dda-like helicase [Bacillus phage vB_BcoS-136]AYP68220.1 exodeoxyribonuclease V alpha chain [Bacillus phage vB_BcoS-136]